MVFVTFNNISYSNKVDNFLSQCDVTASVFNSVQARDAIRSKTMQLWCKDHPISSNSTTHFYSEKSN